MWIVGSIKLSEQYQRALRSLKLFQKRNGLKTSFVYTNDFAHSRSSFHHYKPHLFQTQNRRDNNLLYLIVDYIMNLPKRYNFGIHQEGDPNTS